MVSAVTLLLVNTINSALRCSKWWHKRFHYHGAIYCEASLTPPKAKQQQRPFVCHGALASSNLLTTVAAAMIVLAPAQRISSLRAAAAFLKLILPLVNVLFAKIALLAAARRYLLIRRQQALGHTKRWLVINAWLNKMFSAKAVKMAASLMLLLLPPA